MDKGCVTSTDCHWDRWPDNIVSFAGCFLGSDRNYKIRAAVIEFIAPCATFIYFSAVLPVFQASVDNPPLRHNVILQWKINGKTQKNFALVELNPAVQVTK